MNEISVAEIVQLPAELDNRLFIDSMLANGFMTYHCLGDGRTLLLAEDARAFSALPDSIAGLGLKHAQHEFSLRRPIVVVAHYMLDDKEEMENEKRVFDDLYNLFGMLHTGLFVSFMPSDMKHVRMSKERVEHELSKFEVRMTKGFGNKVFGTSASSQAELFYNSEERRMLLALLNMLNDAMLANGTSYKICFVIEDGDQAAPLLEYLKSRFLVFERHALACRTVGELFGAVRKIDTLPFSYGHASEMLSFSPHIRRTEIIQTYRPTRSGGIIVGKYLEGAVSRREHGVAMDKSAFNLGAIVTGVPGTGKSVACMHITDQLKDDSTRMIVISPTEEWNAFGENNGLAVIKPYASNVPINFFRCGARINVERFYENLAMLIASASNAGPYKNSLEKSLLSAFSKVYRDTTDPKPSDVYEAIEEAIIEQHAVRTTTSVKYTKHGENIRAALQSLRLLLAKPQFSYPEGIDFRRLLDVGTIFDLSAVSNNMKPFFYALILNQVYSFADELDTKGDGELRLLVCIEEAQLVFDYTDQSAAVADLKQRIQDFRKKGVGLMLITHSITDINPSIRRLCQVKLYFRQSPDVAKIAASDLMFDADDQTVINRLRMLEHRSCALTFVEVVDGVKQRSCSTFVQIPEYSGLTKMASCKLSMPIVEEVETVIQIVDASNAPKAGLALEVYAFGERIYAGTTAEDGTARLSKTVPGNNYRVAMLAQKKKDTRYFQVLGGKFNLLRV